MAKEGEGGGGARRGLRHPLGPIRLLCVPFCVLFWAVGCGGDPPGEEALQRRGRFGVFRDLVLFDRPETRGGAFFMDRFETTWGDWSDYLVDTAQPAEPRWAARVTLRRAQGDLQGALEDCLRSIWPR